MEIYLDCYPCILRQAIEASRMAGATISQQKAVVLETLEILRHLPNGVTPPGIGAHVHEKVRQITGNPDPYQSVKNEATQQALTMLPKLRAMINESDDPLETAIRLSIAGNIIDFGPNPDYDLWKVVERVLSMDLSINDLPSLRNRLEKVESILYLADNAGETVFDRLLIETLTKPVTYVVRGGPVLNDATVEDAHAAGIHLVAEVIDNGAQIPGTILTECSPAFQKRFHNAGLILAKGMGNYETLSAVKAPIFFLLQVKCPIIGLDVGVPAGSTVVKRGAGILE